jgi:hypothetical protein
MGILKTIIEVDFLERHQLLSKQDLGHQKLKHKFPAEALLLYGSKPGLVFLGCEAEPAHPTCFVKEYPSAPGSYLITHSPSRASKPTT